MFHSLSYAPSSGRSAAAYRQIGASTAVDSASPHKLVSLLFAAFLDETVCARGAIARGDVVEKGRAIRHAVRIVEEGLIAPLNLEAGGAVAANLNDVYAYVVIRMTMANLRNDATLLAECHDLIAPIYDSWLQIKSQVQQGS